MAYTTEQLAASWPTDPREWFRVSFDPAKKVWFFWDNNAQRFDFDDVLTAVDASSAMQDADRS